MHLDGFFFNCLVREINAQLAGSRVEDIYSTQGGNILLQFRAPGRTLRLEISVSYPPYAFFLSDQGRRDKAGGPLAQTLKKHLAGLFCISVENPLFDRRAVLSFGPAPDSPAGTSIYIEIMGRQNDLILCQEDSIVVSTRSPRWGGSRPLQPGDRYTPPPEPSKLLPQDISAGLLKTLFENIGTLSVQQALVRGVLGLSPILAGEVCRRAQADPGAQASALPISVLESLSREIIDLAQASLQGEVNPALYDQEGPYWTELQHKQLQNHSSLSSALAVWNEMYRAGSGSDALRTRLQAAITAGRRKLQRTLAKQEAEMDQTQEAEHFRQIGDTILASIHAIPRGAATVSLENVHTGLPLDINLNPDKSASSNAAYYYKRYTKYKNALEKVKLQINKNLEQLDYLNSLDYAVESAATLADLQETEQEMQEQGLLRRHTQGKKKAQPNEDYLIFSSPQGDQIMVGKNNRQNEVLTLRKADKSHYWLHARHFPGSHVILCTANPSVAALEFAASLAAWHSKSRSAPKVEVVWTQVKNVKKIPGAKPGMVQYSDYHSADFKPRHSDDAESQ